MGRYDFIEAISIPLHERVFQLFEAGEAEKKLNKIKHSSDKNAFFSGKQSLVIIIFLLMLIGATRGQTKVTKVPKVKDPPKPAKTINVRHADDLSFDRSKSNAKVLTGNVVCEHDGALLNCDTALIYDGDNKMEASGHIVITKGDSIRVTGDKLHYDGKTKMAILQNNVKCVEKDMTLTTNLLTFDVGNSIANYYEGGTIVNKENTLVSKNGHYYSATKELAFHYDVVLTNPDYKMKSDTLRYNTITKTSFFLGPSIIQSKTDYIYCENGWYDTNKEKGQFSVNSVLVTKEQKLTGDSLYFDRNTRVGRGYRNVRLIDTAHKSIIYGDYIEYHEKKSEALITKKAIYARVMEKDTLYIAADTLYHRDIDSADKFLNAYHNVKLFKRDMQAVCDSAVLNTKDSLMQMYKSPVLWSSKAQATSKFIKVNIGRNTIYGFKLEGNSFLIQQADSLNKYNQLTGKSIEGFIVKDTIRKAIVTGNAEIFYYPKNKTKTVGLNKTTSSEIFLWFKNDEIDRVTLKPKTDGVVDPIKDIDVDKAKLKGFNWQYELRPKSKAELHSKHIKTVKEKKEE
jgi:lipopolysaccharide export system protein LptA